MRKVEIHYLWYVVFIGTIGSIISFFKSSRKKCFSHFFNRILDGVFSAYIVYELVFYFCQDMKVSYASCGIGAWFGSDALVMVRDFFLAKYGIGPFPKCKDDWDGNERRRD